jgi:periplasmic copper chaperone A
LTVARPALALLLSSAIASCGPSPGLEVKAPWTRDTVGGTANAAVFMTINSTAADRLVAASTPVAKRTDLMTMEGGSGAMRMAYLQAIEIPADKPVSLDPAGLHVWLSELNAPLRAGQTFPLLLEFEKAGRHNVTVSVISPAAPPPGGG